MVYSALQIFARRMSFGFAGRSVVTPWKCFHAEKEQDLTMKIQTLIAAAALTLSGAVFAQTTTTVTPRIDKRQANQEKRIDQGAASGTLTPLEAARMDAAQARNDAVEAKVKSDGTVTGKERARLVHREAKTSKKIFRQKHDAQHDLNHDGVKDGKKPA
jgi:hypothetical protein